MIRPHPKLPFFPSTPLFRSWLEVDFPASYAISQVNVFSVQDNWATPVEPTATQTFTLYGVRDFQVQYWTGTAWTTVPGANRSEEHTSELQSHVNLVCRLLLE